VQSIGNFSFYRHAFNSEHYVVVGTGDELVKADVVDVEGKFP
jgi:hypothetical protein